jgi:hypothetical protein
MLRRLVPVGMGLGTLLAFAACGSSPPASTVGVQQPPAAAQVIAPTSPPAPLTEAVPPPPVGGSQTAWQHGRWQYTGNATNPWR